jgi:transcriptional regulator with XRE-family HTH domain
MKSYAQRLRWARKAGRLTQRGLCELAGLSTAHVAFIERGEKNPQISTSEKLADALGVDPVWLMLGRGDMPVAAVIREHVERLLSRPSELQPAAGEDLPRAAGAR